MCYTRTYGGLLLQKLQCPWNAAVHFHARTLWWRTSIWLTRDPELQSHCVLMWMSFPSANKDRLLAYNNCLVLNDLPFPAGLYYKIICVGFHWPVVQRHKDMYEKPHCCDYLCMLKTRESKSLKGHLCYHDFIECIIMYTIKLLFIVLVYQNSAYVYLQF